MAAYLKPVFSSLTSPSGDTVARSSGSNCSVATAQQRQHERVSALAAAACVGHIDISVLAAYKPPRAKHESDTSAQQ
eukprot:16769-Heterococcus_DN1.PRE.6